MADTLIVETAPNAAADDFLVGTSEDFNRRMGTEPGFTDLFQKKYEAGKVRVVAPGTPPTETPIAEPVKPVETTKPVETKPEEEIEVKIRKSDLDKYGSIGEALKGLKEKDSFINHLTTQINDLTAKIGESGQNKVELDRLKTEKADLEKKLQSVPAPTVEAEKIVVETIASLDDLEAFSDEEVGDKILEAKNLKRLISTTNQLTKATPNLIKYNKQLEDKIAALEKQVIESGKKQDEALTKANDVLKQQQEQASTDRVFATCGELQASHEELRTKKALREIDSEYLAFINKLFLVAKAYDAKAQDAVVNKFFFDSTKDGDEIRGLADANGVRPPEEVDKYFALRDTMKIAEDKKLPVDEAYIIRQYQKGELNKTISTNKTDEARRAQEAVENRKQFAATMDSTQVATATQSADAEEQIFITNVNNNTSLSTIKQNPELKKIYDKYLVLHGMEPVNWDKIT